MLWIVTGKLIKNSKFQHMAFRLNLEDIMATGSSSLINLNINNQPCFENKVGYFSGSVKGTPARSQE